MNRLGGVVLGKLVENAMHTLDDEKRGRDLSIAAGSLAPRSALGEAISALRMHLGYSADKRSFFGSFVNRAFFLFEN
jgi:hypothetical protein